MRKIKFIVILIISTIIFYGCRTTIDNKKTLSNEDWVEDIEYLDEILKLNHPDLFKYISKEEWDKNVTTLKSEISDLSDINIKLRIAQIIALIGDSHTYTNELNLLAPVGIESITNEEVVEFPIRCEFFEDGLRVVECDEQYINILGYKLLAINNVEVEEVLKRVSTLMCGDYKNNQYPLSKSKNYMNVYEFLKFSDIVDGNNANYLFENDDKGKITISINSLANKDIDYVSINKKEFKTNQKPDGESDFYWYKNFDEDKLLYFKFNNCVSNTMQGLSEEEQYQFPNIYDFQKRLLKEINKGNFNKLVIDLRENGGGGIDVIESIMSMIKHQTNLIGKDIVVITGKNTGSAAVILAWKLQNQLGVTIVGEESGGNVNLFSTDGKIIDLPNSKLSIRYSHAFMENEKDYIGGVKPDIKIIQTYENYVDGIDDCYEYIKGLG